jgi:hypothetical protein|tara:strand:+ start:1250 stop:1603 length:354 start_codon:yes stop_codon:yes gene_type:complete
MQDFKYREPLFTEEDGTYITIGQTRFFMNQYPDTPLRYREPDFTKFYNSCRVYNLVMDAIDCNSTFGFIYWDPELETISVSYPKGGPLSDIIDTIEPMEYLDFPSIFQNFRDSDYFL